MEESKNNIIEMDLNTQDQEPVEASAARDSGTGETNKDDSQNLFPDSPVYEPEEELLEFTTATTTATHNINLESSETKEPQKRKLLSDTPDSKPKVQKLELTDDEFAVTSQSLDNEVSEITNAKHQKVSELELLTISQVQSSIRSSPRKLKRSTSADIANSKTPKIKKSRSSSVDIARKTPYTVINKSRYATDLQLISNNSKIILSSSTKAVSDTSSSLPNSECVSKEKVSETIVEETNSELDDSQGCHLVFESPTPESSSNKVEVKKLASHSDPVHINHRLEDANPGKINKTRSEGYIYSDQGSFPQPISKDFAKTSDQESTDSACSISMESPDHVLTVTSKLISKLSNGNSSTPTLLQLKHGAEDITPDMAKLNKNKGKVGKNDSFRTSNTTTPSTISPLPNGHSLPMNTPQIPVFDVHVSHNEDNEFLSLYVVRTDNDVGMDMCREYQRISKRFTIDAYAADNSLSNSPSSVTSGGMINLPNRTSFVSVVSSTSSSSNRTSDGAFVVPQPPRKSAVNPTTSVKGYEALMKKLQDIFSHIRESSIDEGSHSLSDEKVSIGIQTFVSNDSLLSNGTASPEEVNKCDKVTPKSSLKKTRVKGRRHMAGKTKRALLPTQPEEPEYMHGMNSPEMVPTNGQDGKDSPMKSPKDEKPLSTLLTTPKSMSKLKLKRHPVSPRPATPVEKVVVKPEYTGYPPDTVVLAKWVDKRYYSGKVLEITEPNKYLIKFDDGQSKILLDDFIIFGDMKTLPLEGQSVYAMVDEEQNFEPGLVLGVEENDSGTVTYKCTTDGDTIVMVTASELYLTEDQARSLKEPPAPMTPRRRHHRELDLDNIIQGPRNVRSRDKGNSSTKKRIASPKSPKASTSGVKSKATPAPVSLRKRLASESSEMSESSNSAPPTRLEEVAGVEPEVQRTPRKIEGIKAGPLQLKGAAKQNIGKKNSKLTKFENDEDTVSKLGPIPEPDSKLFSGMYFLLTYTEPPKRTRADKAHASQSWHYSSEEDGESTSATGTDTEDLVFCDRPFNKERLREQLEAGGGVVYSHFDDIPKSKYSLCKLIAPRPCLSAKYIQCLAADIRAVSHAWPIMCCADNTVHDVDSFTLPAGWSINRHKFLNWIPPSGKRNSTFFKDKVILLCGDQDTFVKFWERVCTLAGATTRVVNEEDLNMSGALALVAEWDCPHEVQNKANQDNIPLVSTTWVVQCLIEARVIPPTSHDKFSFMYTEPE